jgi:lia operon protein LiaF
MASRTWDYVWGGLLVLVGLFLLLGNLGLLPFSLADLFRYGWPLILIVIGILVLFGGTKAFGQSADKVIRYEGQSIKDVKLSYSLGDYEIHLTGAVIPEGTATVRVSHGIGDLNIWVPRDVPLAVRATSGIGDVQVFEQKKEGFGPRLDFSSPGYADAPRRLDLQADIGIGDIKVNYGTRPGPA